MYAATSICDALDGNHWTGFTRNEVRRIILMPQASVESQISFCALSRLFLRVHLATMNSFLVLMILLLCFLMLILAWFAISSCLGDEIRAAFSSRRRNFVPTTYGQQYARMMGHGGNQAGWEQIEMEDMIDKTDEHRR